MIDTRRWCDHCASNDHSQSYEVCECCRTHRAGSQESTGAAGVDA